MKRVFWFDVLNLWKLDLKPAHGMRDQAVGLTSFTCTKHSYLECAITLIFYYRVIQPIYWKV